MNQTTSVYHDEDAAVILLNDLREIFGRTNCDRAASQQLIAELHDLADGMWLEYRGARDDQPPRKLTPAEMARLLRPFGIVSRALSGRPVGGTRAAKAEKAITVNSSSRLGHATVRQTAHRHTQAKSST